MLAVFPQRRFFHGCIPERLFENALSAIPGISLATVSWALVAVNRPE
jgi:hypothetical protein